MSIRCSVASSAARALSTSTVSADASGSRRSAATTGMPRSSSGVTSVSRVDAGEMITPAIRSAAAAAM